MPRDTKLEQKAPRIGEIEKDVEYEAPTFSRKSFRTSSTVLFPQRWDSAGEEEHRSSSSVASRVATRCSSLYGTGGAASPDQFPLRHVLQ
jgi:hypothetical protein